MTAPFDIEALMKGYSYTIFFSAADEEYVGLCSEFPGLSWLDDTPAKAAEGIHYLIREVLEDMRTTGETPPAPQEKA